ncbi:phage head-tail connector protein, partial [Acinetobacter baumannii]
MITLDQAKLHCRIDEDEEDSLILKWIADAEEVIQNDLDRKVIVSESDRVDETDILD